MPKEKKIQHLQEQSVRGLKWVGIAEILIRIIQFGTTIVLARLLIPQDFGIISIALIFSQLVFVLFDLGFSSALVQRKELSSLHLSSTFGILFLLASIFSILIFFLSPIVANYFKQEILTNILRVLSLLFFIYSVSSIPKVLLMRELQFKKLAVLESQTILVYSIVTVFFAWNGYGPWCFVYGSLAEQSVFAILLFYSVKWRPSLDFSFQAIKDLFGFGWTVMGTRLISFLNTNLPYVIIGRILGATPLGYYSLSYQLVDFPVQRISKNVLKVMFPALSKIQDEEKQYRELYNQILYHLALITFPIFAGILLFAPEFIKVFYGDKWIPVIRPLQWLTIAGISRSLWTTTSVVFLSKGRPKTEFKINLIYFLVLLPLLLFSTDYGIEGVTICISSLLFFFYCIAFFMTSRIIPLSFREILQSFKIPFVALIAFILTGVLGRLFIAQQLSQIVFLLAILISCLVVYAIVLLRYDAGIIKRIFRFINA